MSNITLYDIKNKFIELAEREDLTEEEKTELSHEIAIELQNKSANIIAYIRNSKSLFDAMKNEEERLANIRKSGENKLDKFIEYVKENMNQLGIDKIQTELGNMSIAKNPMSVEIENEDEVPGEFKQEVTTVKIDKTAIKEYFKSTGELIPGVRIIDNKTSLRIK